MYRRKTSSVAQKRAIAASMARRQGTIMGQGDYRMVRAVGRVARRVVPRGASARVGGALGAAAGTALGSRALGSAIGTAVGKQFAKLTGVGDYEIGSSIMNPRTAPAPRVRNADQDVIISRCEYLGDIASSVTGTPSAFNNQTYFVNPGLNTQQGGAFSWLSTIAAGFQQYRFEQLVFEFRTTSGESVASGNTSLGQVIMAGNYISTNPDYVNKAEMLDSQYAVSGPPSSTLLYPVECKESEQELKFHQIRSGPLKSNQNGDLFDMLKFQIATVGMQANSANLGELWVTYRVRLSKFNTLNPGDVVPTANCRWTGAGGNVDSSHPIGQGGANGPITFSPGSNLAITFDYTRQRIYMPPLVSSGAFLLEIGWFSTAASAWAFDGSYTYTNAQKNSCLFSPNSVTVAQNDGEWNDVITPTNQYFGVTLLFTVTGPGAFIQLGSGNSFPGTVTDLAIIVTQINSGACVTGQ